MTETDPECVGCGHPYNLHTDDYGSCNAPECGCVCDEDKDMEESI